MAEEISESAARVARDLRIAVGRLRRQVVSLSASGRALVDDGRAVRDEWLVRIVQERYTESERRTLVEAMGLLERITEA